MMIRVAAFDFCHGVNDLIQRQRAVLGIVFGLDVRIDGPAGN
jgi:hypothetical protein